MKYDDLVEGDVYWGFTHAPADIYNDGLKKNKPKSRPLIILEKIPSSPYTLKVAFGTKSARRINHCHEFKNRGKIYYFNPDTTCFILLENLINRSFNVTQSSNNFDKFRNKCDIIMSKKKGRKKFESILLNKEFDQMKRLEKKQWLENYQFSSKELKRRNKKHP